MTGNWKRVFRIGGLDRDIEEELAYHRERTVEVLMAEGRSREEAEAEAARRFGDERRYRRELRRVDRGLAARRRMREQAFVVVDVLRKTVRGIVRNPGLAAGVVLTFALGVGANATMFGVVDRLLLSPPDHVRDPASVKRILVERYNSFVGERRISEQVTYPDFRDFRASETSTVAAYGDRGVVIGAGLDAFEADAELATGNYFGVLGVRPALGRFFTPAEDVRGGPKVAVLGHRFWQRRFGGDPDALGRTLELGDGSYTVIGVAPEGFTGVELEGADVWLPLHVAAYPGFDGWMENRFWYWMNLVGRLAPDAAEARSEAELTLVHHRGRQELIEADRYDAEAAVVLAPLQAAGGPLASDESRVAKWLAGLSLLVLLIATFNVANLLLARSSERRREVAVRLALGVSRKRLAGEMLVEGLTLSFLGAAAALLVAGLGGRALYRILLPDVVWPDPINARLILFTVAVAAMAGAAALALPMARAVRQQVGDALRSARGVVDSGSRVRSGLTALQAALSVVLLAAAGLFVQSLQRARTLDLGFDATDVYLVDAEGDDRLEGPGRDQFYMAAADRLTGIPQVAAATVTGASRPLSGANMSDIRVPGRDSLPELAGNTPVIHAVDERYLPTMGLDLEAGRWVRAEDVTGAAPVVVVNRALVELVLGADPLGSCVYVESEGPCRRVVGVVATTKQISPTERPRPQLYIPIRQQESYRANSLLVRARPGAEGTIPAIRTALLDAAPAGIRYIDVRPLAERLVPFLRPWRLGAHVFTAFGVLALLVAGIGLYSLLAYEVSRRRPEIGIRGALGATRKQIARAVASRSLSVVGAGIGVGLILTALIAPRAAELLYETSPWDPVTLGVVPGVLLLVALAAAAGPAMRAARVDPAEALRAE